MNIAKISLQSLAFVIICTALSGCMPPQTVPFVDINRYAGLWYQVAGYEFGPTDGLVGITAEYALLENGKVSVLNRGFVGDFNGEEDVIEGVATVVDIETNAKLEVRFPSVLGGLFAGKYWIISLDEVEYSYAVVSDPMRFTLFILSRTPQMDEATLNGIIDDLVERGYDREKIVIFPQLQQE
jgi:apolipoprotein D and lipocalin family protein